MLVVSGTKSLERSGVWWLTWGVGDGGWALDQLQIARRMQNRTVFFPWSWGQAQSSTHSEAQALPRGRVCV